MTTLMMMNKERKHMIYYRDFLNNLKDGTVLIIDTCCILHDCFSKFAEVVSNDDTPHYKVMIPIDVYLETSKLSVYGKLSETRQKAAEGLAVLHKCFAAHKMQLMREYSTCAFFADPSIIGATLALSTSSDVIVMTQDCNLSRDIRAIAKSEAVFGGSIDVYKLASRDGLFSFIDLSRNQIQSETVHSESLPGAVKFLIKDGEVSIVEDFFTREEK